MTRKKLWLIVLTVVLCLSFSIGLAACGKSCGDNDYESTTALQIANKAELQAEWFEDDEDRTLKLILPPELSENDVRVTSNNPAVVLAEGKTLKAAGVGIAKITVFADDESDSVNITVKRALKEISITNKNELRKIVVNEERTVEFSAKPDAFDIANANVEITSDNAGVAAVDGKVIKAVGVGETTLTVKVGKYSDTVDISVINLSNPSFGIEDGVHVKGAVNSEIELPFVVLSCDGTDLRGYVEAVCDAGLTFDKDLMTVSVGAVGEYSVKMSVADPRNAEMKASVEFKVNAYRKLFADYNGYGNIGYEIYEDGKQFVADEEQVASFDRWDATFASFDMQPSRTYYAELVVDSASKADWLTFYGMTHSVKGDATRFLTAYVDRGAAVTREPEEGEESRYYSGARDFRIKDIDILNDADCWQLHQGNGSRTQILYTYGLNRYRGIDKAEPFPCKIATARIGDFFYFFVNDDYVCAVTSKYLKGKDSVPGYFQQSGIKTDIKNIVWLTGTDAEEKFNTLTDGGSKLFSEYAPNEWWKNENEASEHISHSTEGDTGANYTFDSDALTGENKGIVTPYIFFDGDFTFEWEYRFAADSAAGNWDRFMGLEARHVRDEKDVWQSNYSNKYAFLFGGMRQDGADGNDICTMVKCFSKEKPDDWDWERPQMADGGKEWYKNSQKLKYSVTRICKENGDGKPFARYTFVIQRTDGSERSVWTYDDYGLNNWNSPCEPVILLWKNKGVKGEYSNVKWSVPEDGVAINNKESLQKKWTVGDADRTVAVGLSGKLEGPATVTSSNDAVISADGYTLTAVGGGTATITVKVGSFTDCVTITVTPALSGVSISNKSALSSAWKLSDGGTRDVEIAFSPAEHYNADNTPVTITSSNTNVLTVDGNTLTAVGAGRTTITISVGDLKDTAVIIITTDKPVLSLESSSDIYGEAGGEITLPEYTVISVEGEEVENPDVTITCDNATVTGGKLTATEPGEYTVTYSYAGADSVTTTVYVYRKAISSVFAEGDDVKAEYTQNPDCIDNEKQTVTFNTKKNTYAQFNMAAGSSFYAEATFVVAAQGGNDNYYGLYAADPAVTTRYLAVMTDRGNDKNNECFRAAKVVDFDTTKDNWTDVSSTKYWTRNVFNYGRQITEKAEGSVTVALARINDTFYMFIDDQFIMGFTAKDYGGKDLVVGIFQKNAVDGTQITAMNYLAGNAAAVKLSDLTDDGNKLIDEYKPDSYWAGVNVAGGHIESSADVGKGINFTFKDADQSANASAVTPNLYFDGNFTFEWEFKFAEGTTGGTGNDWNKCMRVELRNYDYSDWGLSLTATAKWDGGNNLCIGANANRDANSDLSGFWLNEGAYAYRYKFSISRVCNAAGSANYRFRAWYYQGSNYVPVYDRYFLGTELNSFGAPDAPAIIVMKTSNVAGEYTNINWTTSEKWTVPNYSFDISDKTELTKKWVAGSEEERSVNISASRDLFGYYTVTSSDPEVISVEGNKLKALKGGTATITVTFGNLTDSVTITVTPALESVSISNKSALTAEWKLSAGGTRNVEVAYAPSDIYNADNTQAVITSSNTNVITVDGNTLTAVGAGRTTITVSVGELTDTAVIIITTDKPVLSLESSSDIYGEAGDEITLPGYTVISIEGEEVENPAVSVTCDNATVTDGKLTATELGEYTVTYSYAGADSVTTTVYVYRKAIISIFAEGDDVKAQYTQNADCIDNEKQTVTFDTKKNTYAQFNMAAGENFYAEATFVVAPQNGNDNHYGLYASEATNAKRYIAAMTDRGRDKNNDWHRAIKVVDFDTTKDNWTDVGSTKFWCSNVFKYGRKITETAEGRVTVALARIDDIFYMFIDGQAITGFTAEYYNGKDLVVGLFQKNAVDGTQITAMNYLSGNAAVNKFNTLTDNGSKFLGEYRYNDWWDSVNSASEHIASSVDASKGANYTFNGTVADENAGIVTPYVSFDGDFTFEWEFKFAAGTTGGNWNKFMRVEVRTAEHSDWGVRFTATAQENGGNNLCIGANVSRNEHSDLSGVWLKDEGYASLYKFSISRVCNAEGNANYRFKAWKKSGGEYELVYERYLIGTQFNSFGAPDTPAIIVIKTVNVAGEYTNIKCSIPEKWTFPESQVEITNKSDLTQRWIEGGGNRNVAVTVNPDWFGYYTITSSDSEVISVEGTSLCALAAGTATVTLTAGNKTDSVEITVIPVLSGVSITNKSALSAAWKLSDGGTRSVDVAYSPAEHYNADNTDVTITSSNTGVLTVDGKTLTPVGIGRTTITVSAGGKSDTVEVTVAGDKPALSLESSSDIYGEAGSEIALPGYTVISVEGDEVENPAVSVTCDNATVTDGKLTATEPGEYTVTYSYAGADSVTTTVYVYRKAIASVFAEGDDVEAQYTQNADCIDDEKQTVTFNTKKNTYAQFNMSAGSNFYAEATFVVAAQGGNDNYYGLYAADPTVTTRYLAVMTDRGVKANEWERAVKVVDFDTTKNNWTDVSSTKYWCRNVFNYGRQITEKAEGSVTVALARINDTFYMFIDDQLITCFTAKDYSGKDLVVGLFQKNAVDGTQITAMNYLSGNDAQTKLNAMTDNGNKLISGYRPNGDWVNNNTANGHIESSTEANKGINFTFKDATQGEDASAVTPNVYLDGDFTFEWEFKFAAGTPEGTDWNKYMRVELRNYDYSDWGFRFSASAQTLGSDNLCIGVNVNDGTDLGGYWSYDENYAGQYKFSITRKLNSSGAKSKFIFKAWKKNAGGEYELVHDKSWEDTQVGSGGNAFGDVTQPVIVVIKSRNVAGEYTNIKWSTTAAQN